MTSRVPSAKSIVQQAADLFESNYAFPDKGVEVAAKVRKRITAGDFANVKLDRDFIRSLTKLFRELSGDLHVGFAYFEAPQPMLDEETFEFGQIDEEDVALARVNNYGFYEVRRLAGNIGYIDLRMFAPVEIGAEIVAAAMTLIADTEALILDVRKNSGGKMNMIACIASYLFDEPVQTSSLHNCITGETTDYWTSAEVPGRRFGVKPLYMLIGPETFSGGENLAYDLKQLGRVTLVGAKTAGAANATKIYTLTPHVWMAVTYGYCVHPVTKTSFEGIGVEPDVAIDPDEALEEAHRLALLEISKNLERDWPQSVLDDFKHEVSRELERLSGD
ncbi:S41 family peptidase [Candidatus Bipolaricaulota bacterium]